MPTEKRLRKREGRQVRLAEARAAEARNKRRRQFVLLASGLVALFLVFVAISVFGNDKTKVATDTTSTTAGATTTTVKTPEVVVPDGPAPTQLKIDDIKVGTGNAVQDGDRVEVLYVGKNFRTKKVFDSNYGQDTLKVRVGTGGVIKGWDKGLLGMKVGGVRRLVIPADLAYGATGSGADIGPNDALVFVVELKKLVRPTFTYGTGACPPQMAVRKTPATFADAPKRCMAEGTTRTAVVGTSEGSFEITLDGVKAPGTVNNFTVLTNWGWFDGNEITRVVPGFVIQGGGSPGRESPGYTIPDELPKSMDEYVKYSVAMANTGQPDSGAGQWFVCIDCSKLPGPNYTIFGKVTKGMDVIDKIEALGTPGKDGPPSKKVVIQGVDVL